MKSNYNLPPGCTIRDIDPHHVCVKCGDEFHGDGDYCDECGEEITPDEMQPITPNRICFGMAQAEYFQTDGLSKSALDLLHVCPARYKAFCDGSFKREQTDAMQFGSLCHAAVLEGKVRYVVRPDVYGPDAKKWNANAKECRAWLDQQEEDGFDVVTADEASRIELLKWKCTKHAKLGPLLANSRHEVSIFGDWNGRVLKGRADALGKDFLMDLKFVADASDRAMARFVIDRRYHVQFAHYRRILRLNDINPERFIIAAIEKGDDALINVKEIPVAIVDVGEIELDRDMQRLAECEGSGIWPDYSGAGDAIEKLFFPNWAYYPQGDSTENNELIIGGKAHAL